MQYESHDDEKNSITYDRKVRAISQSMTQQRGKSKYLHVVLEQYLRQPSFTAV